MQSSELQNAHGDSHQQEASAQTSQPTTGYLHSTMKLSKYTVIVALALIVKCPVS